MFKSSRGNRASVAEASDVFASVEVVVVNNRLDVVPTTFVSKEERVVLVVIVIDLVVVVQAIPSRDKVATEAAMAIQYFATIRIND